MEPVNMKVAMIVLLFLFTTFDGQEQPQCWGEEKQVYVVFTVSTLELKMETLEFQINHTVHHEKLSKSNLTIKEYKLLWSDYNILKLSGDLIRSPTHIETLVTSYTKYKNIPSFCYPHLNVFLLVTHFYDMTEAADVISLFDVYSIYFTSTQFKYDPKNFNIVYANDTLQHYYGTVNLLTGNVHKRFYVSNVVTVHDVLVQMALLRKNVEACDAPLVCYRRYIGRGTNMISSNMLHEDGGTFCVHPDVPGYMDSHMTRELHGVYIDDQFRVRLCDSLMQALFFDAETYLKVDADPGDIYCLSACFSIFDLIMSEEPFCTKYLSSLDCQRKVYKVRLMDLRRISNVSCAEPKLKPASVIPACIYAMYLYHLFYTGIGVTNPLQVITFTDTINGIRPTWRINYLIEKVTVGNQASAISPLSAYAFLPSIILMSIDSF